MKYCGIELKGNEAIIVSIRSTSDSYELIAQEMKKIKLMDPDSQDSVQNFTKDIYTFFDAMLFDKICIKSRGKKGRFAGGPTSFKIEGIIQNCNFPVRLMHIATIKSKLKNKEPDLSIVSAYQGDALRLAICAMD